MYKVARPVGSMLSGIMMELCGRRLAVQIFVASVSIGYFLIVESTSNTLLLVGIAVCLFGLGAIIPAIFVSKIQRKK